MKRPAPAPTVFLSSILCKMSQMFSELSTIYLDAMASQQQPQQEPTIAVQPKIANETTPYKEKPTESKANIPQIKPPPADILKDQNQDNNDYLSSSSSSIKKKTKKQTTSRLEDAPIPPPSSYQLFFKDHRATIVESYPNASLSQLNKVASQLWSDLTKDEKKQYHQKFAQEKQKYYEALKEYQSRAKSIKPKVPSRKKTKKQSDSQPLSEQ